MSRHPRGATPSLTEELIERLSASIRRGVYVETACALCGISKDTFYRWLKQSKTDDATELVQKLSDAVERAMAEAEARDLEVLDAAAQAGAWQAAAWRLERKHPERWGRRERMQLEHSGPEGKPIQVDERRTSIRKLIADPNALAAVQILEEKLRGSDG